MCIFNSLEQDASHKDDFPCYLHKFPSVVNRSISRTFWDKYVTYIKLNQAEQTLSDFFNNGLIIGKKYPFQ
jgi:hypothetical protein